jgi:NAD(P)-dependent dehydrogenase (short-subunit alcohol dehydrogenase family)
LGCRSLEKGQAAKDDIEYSTDTKGTGVIEVWHVSLSSYASVREFCARANKLDQLDAVVLNAGVATPHFEIVEGTNMETTIVVNVISTFFMALLLLPKLRESGVKFNTIPKLTIVASDAHELVCACSLRYGTIANEIRLDSENKTRHWFSESFKRISIKMIATTCLSY